MSLCDHGHGDAHDDCRGPIVNIAFRCLDPDRPGHVEVDVFVGRRHQGRGRAGRIMLRSDEWTELQERILEDDPIELGLTS
jgi:hypothetical protein